MSFCKSNLNSSTSDMPAEPGYESLTYSDNAKKGGYDHYRRVDYITLPKTRQNEHGTYLFWTLVVVLFILAVGNLILTFIILGVLRLGQGMESLELVSEESLIKFYGNTDLDKIYKRDGKIESFNESPLEILGDGNSALITLIDGDKPNLPTIEFNLKNGIIKNIESFQVNHPITGESIFSTDFPNFGLPRGVNTLDVKSALTKKIASPVDQSLIIKSDRVITLKGNEGTHMEGRQIIWSADQDIFLKSVNRSIIFNGIDGVFVDVKNIPRAEVDFDVRSHIQYKICVCMPMGKLFRVAIPPGQISHVGCHGIDRSFNPCI